VRQPFEVHANSYCEGLLAQTAFAFGSLHVDIHSFWGSGEKGEGPGQKLRVQRDRIAVLRREGEGVHTSVHVINWRSRTYLASLSALLEDKAALMCGINVKTARKEHGAHIAYTRTQAGFGLSALGCMFGNRVQGRTRATESTGCLHLKISAQRLPCDT
jgi:hypothetical protein